MEIQEIEVTIGRTGQIEISVRGMKGNSCLEITNDLEQALGGVILTREMNPEAFANNPSQIDQTDHLRSGK
jgi:hypothetical protein